MLFVLVKTMDSVICLTESRAQSDALPKKGDFVHASLEMMTLIVFRRESGLHSDYHGAQDSSVTSTEACKETEDFADIGRVTVLSGVTL